MATFTKGLLSGTIATEGQAYAVGTSDTIFHNGPSVATSIDEIWVYATNASAADAVLSIGWGGTPAGLDKLIKLTIPKQAGYKLVIPGLILKGNSDAALGVQCSSSIASGVRLTGYVNHITA